MRDEVVGITKFCVHPEEWFRSKTRVGGTKKLKIDLIKSLQPDLIIANKEENTRSDIDALTEFSQVYISDIKTIDDAYKMIAAVGGLANKKSAAEKLIAEIKTAFRNYSVPLGESRRGALYFIWRNPYMIAGGDTFISEMMNLAGFENVVAHLNRYPTLSESEICNLQSEIFFLSSEPFPFKQKHIDEMQKYFQTKNYTCRRTTV